MIFDSQFRANETDAVQRRGFREILGDGHVARIPNGFTREAGGNQEKGRDYLRIRRRTGRKRIRHRTPASRIEQAEDVDERRQPLGDSYAALISAIDWFAAIAVQTRKQQLREFSSKRRDHSRDPLRPLVSWRRCWIAQISFTPAGFILPEGAHGSGKDDVRGTIYSRVLDFVW